MPFCPNCGKSVDADKRFCVYCGAPLASASPAPAPQATTAAPEKNTAIAAIASFLFPGLGQVYNGGFVRGLCIFFGTLVGYLFFVIPGIIVWIYGIYDAYKTADSMNRKETPFVPHSTTHIIAFVIIGIVALIVYFIVIVAMMALVMGGMML